MEKRPPIYRATQWMSDRPPELGRSRLIKDVAIGMGYWAVIAILLFMGFELAASPPDVFVGTDPAGHFSP